MKPWRSFTPHDLDTTFELLQTRLHERFLPTSLPISKYNSRAFAAPVKVIHNLFTCSSGPLWLCSFSPQADHSFHSVVHYQDTWLDMEGVASSLKRFRVSHRHRFQPDYSGSLSWGACCLISTKVKIVGQHQSLAGRKKPVSYTHLTLPTIYSV